jgi:hypothetical protein
MRANTVRWQQALKRQAQWKRFASLAALLLVVISPAWSDIRSAAGNFKTKKTCYCNCDMKPGAKMCTQMCELPKYQNRSWAVSCQKKQESAPSSVSPAQRSHSKKRNSVEDARL